ncbi:MAG: hypothetical protein K8U03_19660 [Planctomycetia bacterium]|nr:hypothetical protein [Planctomycetia bacterium]
MTSAPASTYSSVRSSGFANFLLIQLAILSVGTAWGATRWKQQSLERAMPLLRSEPITVRPIFDYPVVVSDEQLRNSLLKLRPKKQGAKTKLNHVDHALRFWTAQAKFKDPAYFSGEELRGILTDNRKFVDLYGPKQPPLLIDAPYGVKVRLQEGNATASHADHTVAGLSEVGTPLNFPVITPNRRTSYRAMVDEALHDFSLNQVEYEWSALTMIAFLPPVKSWTTTEGQRISFDDLAARIMREEQPRGVCFGNHRLYTLTMFLRVDDEHHVLSPETRIRAIAYLMSQTATLVQHQHSDGYWDGKWPLRPAAGDGKDSATGDSVTDRILATGHALEWWAMAPIECHPPREVLVKAGQWMVRTIENLTPEQADTYYTFLTHAGRSLALWRGKLPNEVELNEVVPAPEKKVVVK